jgi:hypothetical protein
MPYPYTSEDEITFTGAPSPLTNEYAGSPTSSNPRELYDFEYDLSAHMTWTGADGTVEYSIISGQLPNDLTLDSATGQISGTVVDLDTWVDWTGTAYERPTNYIISKDGSNFGSWGSAQAKEYDATFTVRAQLDDAPDDEFSADMECIIKVVNNFSSDRDQFIREYSAQYGASFQVDGKFVDANTYLDYQKSLGNFPALTSNTGYLPGDTGYIAS